MRLHYFQHEAFEGPGNILPWAQSQGFAITATHFYMGETITVRPQEVDLLIVMGGSMNADEEEKHPWMAAEKAFIRAAVDAGGYVLGICLGAQLAARVLGAKVTRNPHKEIGWFPVSFSPEARALPLLRGFPEILTVFHWHGDTFALPEGAVRLAASEACPNQAYLWQGRVLGLQFHMETSEGQVADFAKFGDAEIRAGGPYVQAEAGLLGGLQNAAPMRFFLELLLSQWLENAPFFQK